MGFLRLILATVSTEIYVRKLSNKTNNFFKHSKKVSITNNSKSSFSSESINPATGLLTIDGFICYGEHLWLKRVVKICILFLGFYPFFIKRAIFS